MNLNKNTIKEITNFLSSYNIRSTELGEELLDHLCAAVENAEDISDIRTFLTSEMEDLAPEGLLSLEQKYHFSSIHKNQIVMKQIMYTIGLLSSISLATGILFKLMQWPGANVLLLVGIVLLFLVFIPYSVIRSYRGLASEDKLNKVRLILGLSTSVVVALSVLFKFLHLMGANILFVIGMGIGILGFLPLQFVQMYRRSNSVEKALK